MKVKQFIQRLISGFLICTLVLSITPVFVAHTLFAKHLDKKNTNLPVSGTHLSTSGFHCNCENFVAESQFLYDHSAVENPIRKIYFVFKHSNEHAFFSQHHFFAELRGPPALA